MELVVIGMGLHGAAGDGCGARAALLGRVHSRLDDGDDLLHGLVLLGDLLDASLWRHRAMVELCHPASLFGNPRRLYSIVRGTAGTGHQTLRRLGDPRSADAVGGE